MLRSTAAVEKRLRAMSVVADLETVKSIPGSGCRTREQKGKQRRREKKGRGGLAEQP
ncbi:hypothetical protein PLUA15_350072 [Pseudomonas lundensis]|uniref:Uncharacterized protein n=1 Tax=Pseudomonas lundensis TaxID=86185 RepID=A0AAX2HB13_9PSED|nr:hypothetical protein PLUA15_350072 [Pseudomonas lundensis]